MPKTATALVLTLGLLLPATMLGGALWLTGSGVIERLAEGEQQNAAQQLDAFAEQVMTHLRTVATAQGEGDGRFAIEIDGRGRVSGPFTPWPSSDRTSDGRSEFELSVARLLAERGDLEGARERLAQAREMAPPLITSPLPFDLLARLLAVQLSAEAGDSEVARGLRTDVLEGRVPMPAAAARPVLEFLDTLAPGRLATADAFFGAAGLTALLEEQHIEPPSRMALAPNGALVVPDGARLHLIGAKQCEELIRCEIEHGWPTDAGLTLSVTPSARAIATTTLAPLPLAVHAAFSEVQPSERLVWLARALLVLAGVAFLFGNLLALRIAKKERALARSKSSFIELVSHELRTPLQALALKTEMLAHGLVPPARVTEYCRDAHVEVGRLVALVQRILDFSRLARRTPEVVWAPTHLRTLLARCVREVRPSLVAAHQHLVVDAARSLGSLTADAELLACAIRNLLHNASKYSPPRTEIVLSAERCGGTIRVQIEDRGPGVAAHEREAVFAPFRRGEGAMGGRIAGSGLGLSLVAGAMRVHRGVVTVTDRVGGGAVFTLSLPVHEESA